MYEITIKGIQANSPEQAAQIAAALETIKNQLSNTDLIDLAQLLKQKPGIVQKAKQFANLL
jgi:hypothetical protein